MSSPREADHQSWVSAHVTGGPDALRTSVDRTIAEVSGQAAVATRLEAAARNALRRATGGSRARVAALDLLTADALITLALQREAETRPETLGAFAAGVRHAPSAPQPEP